MLRNSTTARIKSTSVRKKMTGDGFLREDIAFRQKLIMTKPHDTREIPEPQRIKNEACPNAFMRPKYLMKSSPMPYKLR